MAESSSYLELISELLTNNIKAELSKLRPSRAFDGRKKPVGGGFGSISNRIATGDLYESVEVKFNEQSDKVRIELTMAPEWRYVNYGRRGKQQSLAVKYPPLSAIENWAAVKGIGQFRDKKGRFISNDTRNFLLQRSIGEYGIFPTRFVEEGFNKTRESIEFYLGEYGKAFLEELIQNKIIIKIK
jgi:hypothetical protein